eukprot:10981462-Lingulodinium_polyedra.AAC.1
MPAAGPPRLAPRKRLHVRSREARSGRSTYGAQYDWHTAVPRLIVPSRPPLWAPRGVALAH